MRHFSSGTELYEHLLFLLFPVFVQLYTACHAGILFERRAGLGNLASGALIVFPCFSY